MDPDPDLAIIVIDLQDANKTLILAIIVIDLQDANKTLIF
jgi:hypothetical protein